MGQIRHIAISSDDTEKLARFYKEVFGFRQSRPTPEGTKNYLFDRWPCGAGHPGKHQPAEF